MKFLLDTMLGHLVTWLRLLGYDTVYSREVDDEEAIEAAKKEGRIIITRDKKLASNSRKQGVETILLETTDLIESLKKIRSTTGIDLAFNEDRSRCPECNMVLEKVSQHPPRWICPGCGKSYWKGRHWRNINKTLKILEEM